MLHRPWWSLATLSHGFIWVRVPIVAWVRESEWVISKPVFLSRAPGCVSRVLTASLVLASLIASAITTAGAQAEPRNTAPTGLDPHMRLRVTWLHPVDATPGEAVLLDVSGLDASGTRANVVANLSAENLRLRAEVLSVQGSRVVIRLPRELPPGTAKLRLHQGQRRSKPRLLQVARLSLQEPIRNVLGGLAFLLLGLSTLAHTFRRVSGNGLRGRLSALTKNPVRSALAGVMVGAASQSSAASTGVVVGLLRAHLLAGSAAVGVLLGAQLGASTAGTLLPLFASREALWLITLGALWSAVVKSRRNRSIGHMLLGAGTLFLGLAYVQDGLRPLLSEPALLPLIADLGQNTPLAALLSVGLGALLAALLQGPGPAFAAVVAMAQVTPLLTAADCLRILSGVGLGACVTTAAIALPIGRTGQRLTLASFAFGVIALLITWFGAPWFVTIASNLSGQEADAITYGTRVLRPEIAGLLALAFTLSQLAAALLTLPLIPALTRLGLAAVKGQVRTLRHDGDPPTLVPALDACRDAILSIGEVVTTRDRGPAMQAEAAIAQARNAIKTMLNQLADDSPQTDLPDIKTLTACLHLATATDSALRVAERALERNLPIKRTDATRLANAHGLLTEGIDAIVAHLSTGAALPREEIQAREIRLNALEAEARAIQTNLGALDETVWMKELASAWESVGNHLFRLGTALSPQ